MVHTMYCSYLWCLLVRCPACQFLLVFGHTWGFLTDHLKIETRKRNQEREDRNGSR